MSVSHLSGRQDVHISVRIRGIRRLDLGIYEAIVTMLQFRDIFVEDLRDLICGVHILNLYAKRPNNQ